MFRISNYFMLAIMLSTITNVAIGQEVDPALAPIDSQQMGGGDSEQDGSEDDCTCKTVEGDSVMENYKPPCHCVMRLAFDLPGVLDLYLANTYDGDLCDNNLYQEYWFGIPHHSINSQPQDCTEGAGSCEKHVTKSQFGDSDPSDTVLISTVRIPPHRMKLARNADVDSFEIEAKYLLTALGGDSVDQKKSIRYFVLDGPVLGTRALNVIALPMKKTSRDPGTSGETSLVYLGVEIDRASDADQPPERGDVEEVISHRENQITVKLKKEQGEEGDSIIVIWLKHAID